MRSYKNNLIILRDKDNLLELVNAKNIEKIVIQKLTQLKKILNSHTN